MKSHKIRSSSKIASPGDQYFFDEVEIVDDNTWSRSHGDTKDFPIDFAEGCEGFEGCLIFAQQVKASYNRPWIRAGNGIGDFGLSAFDGPQFCPEHQHNYA